MRFIIFFSIAISLINADSINGRVLDKETNEPLQNVNIFLSGSDIGAVTDKNGDFEIDNLEFGEYVISASIIGYKTHLHNINTEIIDNSTYTMKN